MGVSYATREDIYRQGVPRGTLAVPARPIASVDTAANTLELEGHGLATDDPIQFRADAGGSLPSPLAEGATYFAKPYSDGDSRLQVAASEGGSAIDLTTAGANFSLIYAGESGRMIDVAIARASRLVDRHLTAHQVPLALPYPVELVGAVAEIAAASVLAKLGRANDQIKEIAALAREDLKAIAAGIPLRDAAATPQVGIVRGTSPSTSTRCSRVP